MFFFLFYNIEVLFINLCDFVIIIVRVMDVDIGCNVVINYYINENDDKVLFIVLNFGNCFICLMIFKNKVKDYLVFVKESLFIVIFI